MNTLFFKPHLTDSLISMFTLSTATNLDTDSAAGLVKDNGLGVLQHYKVWAPTGLSTSLVDYIDTLDVITSALSNIKKDMLVPLEQWSAHMISDPTYYKKHWGELPTKLIDVAGLVEQLKRHTVIANKDDPFSTDYTDIYPALGDLELCTKKLKSLLPKTEILLSDDINNLIKIVSVRINDIFNNGRIVMQDKLSGELGYVHDGGSIGTLSKGLAKYNPSEYDRLLITLDTVSKAVELMGIVIFSTEITNNLHTKTVEKIKNEL